jgi:hypothetical protein
MKDVLEKSEFHENYELLVRLAERLLVSSATSPNIEVEGSTKGAGQGNRITLHLYNGT